MAAPVVRIPSQARSVATRRALLDAALESLAERGYAATTTIETARRAGVSRGAQLHHFRTRSELLTAAVTHLLEQRKARFRELLAEVDPNADRLDAALDLLWSMFEGPMFAVWAELWLAARTDPELAAAVNAMDEHFTSDTRALFLELFPEETGADSALYDIGRDFAFALMTGLALQHLVPRPRRPVSDYLDTLKQSFHLMRADATRS